MSRETQFDNLQEFITRVGVISTVTDVKVKVEADKIKLSAYDRQNKYLLTWEEDADKVKVEEVKSILENNKINFSDGEWSEDNIK